jgi:hypothetical protein
VPGAETGIPSPERGNEKKQIRLSIGKLELPRHVK